MLAAIINDQNLLKTMAENEAKASCHPFDLCRAIRPLTSPGARGAQTLTDGCSFTSVCRYLEMACQAFAPGGGN
jgi:hypothetical protein